MKNEDLDEARFYDHFSAGSTQWNRNPECWRYMDLLSLLTILENSSLHFTHIRDLFRFDPSEGTGGLLTNVVNTEITPQIIAVPSDPYIDERNQKEIKRIEDELKIPLPELLPRYKESVRRWDQDNQGVHISCWHTNPVDSDFMWRIYGKMEYGFAIASTVQSVVQSIRDAGIDAKKVGGGFVLYPTRDEVIRDGVDKQSDSSRAFMIKSPQFKAEHEFRVFVKAKRVIPSCDIPVSLRTLIRGIFVSPLMPRWAIGPAMSVLNPICRAKGLPDVTPPKPPLREI
jgi:hypothetical protein